MMLNRRTLHKHLAIIVVFLLACLVPAASRASAPNVSPIYLPIARTLPLVGVSPVVGFRERSGDFALGEIINLTATQTVSVTLQITLYNSANGTLRTVTTAPRFPVTLPRQANPFVLGLGVNDVVRDVVVQQVTPISNTTYTTLTVVSRSLWPCTEAGVVMEGVIRNDGAVPVRAIQVEVWQIDNQRYWAWDFSIPEKDTLQPGEETTFATGQLPICGLPGYQFPPSVAEQFEVVAQAIKVP